MRKSIVLSLGSLCVLSLALSGCESDSGGTENSGTGGDGVGGTGGGSNNSSTGGTGNPGSGGDNNPGTGGNSNPGTGGNSNPGTGGNSNPGTGGNSNPGTGGRVGVGGGGGQNQQGGQAGAPSAMCQPSAQCSGTSTCSGTCQTQGRQGARACVCMDGMLFCGQCQVQQAMGSVCPEAPQGKDCPNNTQQCSYGSGDTAGVCGCLADKLVCPGLPAPAGSAACPDSPSFMTCQDEGAYCTRSQNRFCYCAAVGGGNPRWICQN